MYERSQVSKVTTVVNIELPGSEKMYRSMDVVNDRSNSILQINIIITMFFLNLSSRLEKTFL